SNEWFPWALGIGVTFIVVFFLFALSAQKAGVAITAVLSKMSVIIPVSVGIFLYHDDINALKIFGILAAIIAFYLTFKQKGGEKVSKKYLILPLLLFLGNGTNDSLTKHSQMNYVGDEQFLFISTIFSMSLLIGLCIMAYYIIFKGMKITGRSIVAGLILGILNFGSSYFFLLGLYEFESAVFFPIFNVSIVSLSALSGLLFFGERLRPINWLGICIAVGAILLISIA
ncbi:MAG: DMT family transporter, partial [Bacteroidales bacterium]|nr:DMT family transporter [Bacteroidales bacterium]